MQTFTLTISPQGRLTFDFERDSPVRAAILRICKEMGGPHAVEAGCLNPADAELIAQPLASMLLGRVS